MTDVDLSGYFLDRTVSIGAPPDVVHAMVADVTRMGEWSPVNTGGEWEDDSHTWFVGHNEMPGRVWKTRCRVVTDKPGAEFTFVVCGDGDGEYVRWSYTFTPTDTGTDVTESWQPLPDYVGLLRRRNPDVDLPATLAERREWATPSISTTLENLKRAAESGD